MLVQFAYLIFSFDVNFKIRFNFFFCTENSIVNKQDWLNSPHDRIVIIFTEYRICTALSNAFTYNARPPLNSASQSIHSLCGVSHSRTLAREVITSLVRINYNKFICQCVPMVCSIDVFFCLNYSTAAIDNDSVPLTHASHHVIHLAHR